LGAVGSADGGTARPARDERAVEPEQEHHADDGADEAAEVEHVVVADAEQLGEEEEPDEGARETEQDGRESRLAQQTQ